MKKLLLSSLITLTNLSASSQIVTNKDTIIALPKRIVTRMVQDLIKCDDDREQLKLCMEVNATYEQALSVTDSIQGVYKNKIASLRESVNTYESLTSEQELKIRGLEKDIAKRKKHNNWWKTIAIGAIAGIAINHLSWKYYDN